MSERLRFFLLLGLVLVLGWIAILAFGAQRSSQWPALERQFLREHPTCAACGRKATVVHHVIPYHLDRLKELNPANLIALCPRDHFLLGHLDNWSSFNPHVREDCAALLAEIKARPVDPFPSLDDNDTTAGLTLTTYNR